MDWSLLQNPVVAVGLLGLIGVLGAPTITGVWSLIVAKRSEKKVEAAADHSKTVAKTLADHTEEDKFIAIETGRRLDTIHLLVNDRLSRALAEIDQLKHIDIRDRLEKLEAKKTEPEPKPTKRVRAKKD